MNHRILFTLIIAVFMFFTILITGTATSGDVQDASVRLAASKTLIEGTLVVKEGHGDIFVTSENNSNKRRLKVGKDTMINRNGKPATYDDLKVGDKVRVKHDSKHIVLELYATGS